MISLENLTGGYHRETILHPTTTSFPKNKISCLIGPNGSGKSTLLKLASGLMTPYGGAVLLEGQPLSSIPLKALAKRVSYLPQGRNIPNISVKSLVIHGRFPYLGYPRHYRKEDRQAAEEAMDWVGILPLQNRSVPQLSGGERQKAYLAMVIAQNTDLIFLDEPTTYLDIHHQLELMNLILQLKTLGKTVVMVLHDLSLALSYADQIHLLDHGQLQTTGSPATVFQSGQLEQVFSLGIESLQSSNGQTVYHFSASPTSS